MSLTENPSWVWPYKKGKKNVESLKGHPGYGVMHDVGFSGHKLYSVGELTKNEYGVQAYFHKISPEFESRKGLNEWVKEHLHHNPGESAFDRCVDEVTAKGTADDPRAVCAAAGRRKYGAKRFQQMAAAGRRRARGNPVDEAAELSEAWHGRPAKHQTEVIEELHTHGVLTDLGGMEEIGISDGKFEIPIRFGHDTRLCSNEAGTQLYLVGGNQQVDVEPFGIKMDKDCVVIGEACSITYYTSKMHLGKEDKEPGPYRHVFGEEGGERPTVLYDCLNHLISFAGGSYVIKHDLDHGKYSAGIRD